MTLQTAIENLYSTFGKYTTEGIHHCNCGCIDEEAVKKLYSKPLRALEEDDLVYYHGSAIYTWGDIEHYKHYLPRICEMRSQKRSYAFVHLDEIFVKIDYAKWTDWDENEIKAIKDYVLMDWIEFANNEKSEIGKTELESYGKFFEIKELMQLWHICNSENALRNFVLFFYYYRNQILNEGIKFNNYKCEDELISLIHTKNLPAKIEEEFYKHEHIDQDFAQKVSIVHQMIEQEKARIANNNQ